MEKPLQGALRSRPPVPVTGHEDTRPDGFRDELSHQSRQLLSLCPDSAQVGMPEKQVSLQGSCQASFRL